MVKVREFEQQFEGALKKLSTGMGLMDKEIMYFGELQLQTKIYATVSIIGLMMVILGFLL